MKLTTKLVIYLILGIISVELLDGYLSIKREMGLFNHYMEKKTELLGKAMEGMITEVWLTAGERRVLKLIEEANEKENEVSIRWVWLDSPPNDTYSPEVDFGELPDMDAGKPESLKRVVKRGGYVYYYFPINVADRWGALELKEGLDELNQYTKTTIIQIVALMLLTFLIAILVALLLGFRLIGKPLGVLTKAVNRIGENEFPAPIELDNRNELTDLANAFNRMSRNLQKAQEKIRDETDARIETLNQLRHADRLKTVGNIAAGIAHELGTPLNVISGRSALIKTGRLETDELLECSTVISAQIKRMTELIQRFLNYARFQIPEKQRTDVRFLVFKTIDLFRATARKEKITIELSGEDIPVYAMIDENQIQQVLANILTNAIQASPNGGSISIDILQSLKAPEKMKNKQKCEYICIKVSDHGLGIDEKDIDQVFDPFFTTKAAGNGTGLGLSIASSIITEHGGWIDVESEFSKGASFMIYLPSNSSE